MAPQLCALLVLASCAASHPSQPKRQPPETPSYSEPQPALDASIEGRVVDSETHTGLAGVTVIAEPSAARQLAWPAITDETGHYKVDVPAGHHHVSAYYLFDAVGEGEVDASSGATVPLDVEITHKDVVAVEKAMEEKSCPAVPDAPPPSAADSDALVAALLERYLKNRTTVPNGEALPETGPVFVVSDPESGPLLTQGSIPPLEANRLVLRTRRDLQADAKRRGTAIKYIDVYKAEIAGDCAIIHVGVGSMPPRGRESLASCGRSDVYVKQDGRWSFKINADEICACG